MKNQISAAHYSLSVILAAFLACGVTIAAAEESTDTKAVDDHSDQHRVVIAPYGWAMNISGTVGINGIAVPLDLQTTELLRGVKSGGMGYLQVPIGKNFVYLESFAVSFGQSDFQPLFSQSVDANLFFGEAGYGWNIPLESGFNGEGKTTVSPYAGVRVVNLKIKVNGPQLFQTVKKDWIDPVIGVVIQGPVWRKVGYVVKLDVAGFYTDGDNYRSALALLRYTFDPSWSVVAGYRASHFDAKTSSSNGLSMNITGSGPLAGIQYSF